jgi:hypothetical protein
MLNIIVGAILLSGCATPSIAPVGSTGEKINIAVFSDRGNPDQMESRQWQYRNEVGAYMERDLITRLNRTGYNATLIQSKSDYVPSLGNYLVEVKIKKYNPGSTAARIVVGFGAGACSLDLHYVVKNGKKVIQEWDDGIGTSGDWRRLPRALDDKLVRKLNAELLTWK